MASNTTTTTTEPEVIGGAKNFWLLTKSTDPNTPDKIDITHPPTPKSPPIRPRITVQTTKAIVDLDPAKTALVVVDLQNYFLSPAIGRPPDSVGLRVMDRLLDVVIPSCRTAKIPVLWLGWGLTDDDIETMPPTIVKGFAVDSNFKGPKPIDGLGSDIGQITLNDGRVVEGGRVMVRDTWNTEFYPPLAAASEPQQDIWVYKNRLSGWWGGTGIEKVLEERGIRTLIFSGVSTDQCVAGSIQDAYTKGWDCLLLSDGVATTSPEYASKGIMFNTEMGWGFVLTCQQFADGAGKVEDAPPE